MLPLAISSFWSTNHHFATRQIAVSGGINFDYIYLLENSPIKTRSASSASAIITSSSVTLVLFSARTINKSLIMNDFFSSWNFSLESITVDFCQLMDFQVFTELLSHLVPHCDKLVNLEDFNICVGCTTQPHGGFFNLTHSFRSYLCNST